MNQQFALTIYAASTWVIPTIIASTFHEAAHGFVARILGDDMAARLGRVSLNPLRHIDPFGTILLPGLLLLTGSPFLFGYAKPVPVNFGALGRPRRDMVLKCLSGRPRKRTAGSARHWVHALGFSAALFAIREILLFRRHPMHPPLRQQGAQRRRLHRLVEH
jgi:Zn-dependent protease